jgi:dethiobiotin synthetase
MLPFFSVGLFRPRSSKACSSAVIRGLSTTSTSTTIKKSRPIFVAATKQHVGKTTTSLALMSGLQKRFPKVGFIKPVGQQHVPVYSQTLGKEIQVDKDICLLKEQFHLDHIDYQHMSPVIIPRGYTKKYIEGKLSYDAQIKDIESSFAEIAGSSDVVLIEGTGHCAVGSIVNVNNAKVASILGASMVLIANGGLGWYLCKPQYRLCSHPMI